MARRNGYGRGSAQLEQCGNRVVCKRQKSRPVRSKQPLDIVGRAVANAQPDDLWRGSPQDTEAMKVFVLRNQHAAELGGALPHHFVCRTTEVQLPDVQGVWTQVLKLPQQDFRQLLVEEHPHG